MRVVGIVAPFAPLGAGPRRHFVLSSPSGEIGTGDECRVPVVAVRHAKARQTSESGPCGDGRRVLWVPGPWSQYPGKFEVQDEGSPCC